MSVFIFKQKTAYEMRISDWISDVFSSDLLLYYVLGHTVDEQSRAQMEEMGALTRAPISPDSPEVIGGGSDEDLLDGDPTVRFQFGLDLFIDSSEERRVGQECVSRGRSR